MLKRIKKTESKAKIVASITNNKYWYVVTFRRKDFAVWRKHSSRKGLKINVFIFKPTYIHA